MDFSLTLDPALLSASCFTPEDSLEYLASYDFDLFSEGLNLDPSMAWTTESSQLTYSSSSSSNPSPITSLLSSPEIPSSSYYSSDNTDDPVPAHPSRSRKRQQQTSSHPTLQDYSHGTYDPNTCAKRHQTKLACSWCRKLGKKCDAQRPCGRCVQFNRCSECVDAPPRKARAKVDERGTYKKTRDLAAVDYQGAVHKRQAYVTKRERLGRTVKLGLTPDDLLEKAREENAKIMKKADHFGLTSLIDEASIQGRLSSVAGLSEDLFTWSESPETNELDLSLLSSPEDSLFDTASRNVTSVTEVDDTFHVTGWQYKTLDMFPNIMGLIAAARALDSPPNASHLDSLQSRSEIALAT
jgi:hypothetical protein